LGQRKQGDDNMSVMTLRFVEQMLADNTEPEVHGYSHAEDAALWVLARSWLSYVALGVCFSDDT
jgi:hypothetical protein